MIISTFGWIVVGVLVWLAVALALGVLIGRMIRQRDRQIPRDGSAAPSDVEPTGHPDPNAAEAPSSGVVGQGRDRRP